jgi:hypothetical protein
VVDGQQRPIGVARGGHWEEADPVVVVAELSGGGLGGRIAWIEGRRVIEQRIAPADQHIAGISRRDDDEVVGAEGDVLKGERSLRRLGYDRPIQTGEVWSDGQRDTGRGRAAKERASADEATHDALEGLTLRLVGRRVRALVPALPAAGLIAGVEAGAAIGMKQRDDILVVGGVVGSHSLSSSVDTVEDRGRGSR